MATVTTNFNFPIPQSTDLVKDGATAIAALGTSVDTQFVDLKGGTTGQVLAKASNTDLDYVWTSPNPGDITAVTAGTGITGGGTSGDVTVSFDQANFGGGQYAAGKNKIINGDFSVNQRNFSSTTTTDSYGFDRWRLAASDGTVTYSAQTFTLGAAPVAGYEGKNFARVVTTGQTLNTAQGALVQRIESVRTFAGQTATVSFWAKAASGTPKVAVDIRQRFGSGGSPSTNVSTVAGQVTLSTSWTRYSLTAAIPSISGKTLGTAGDDALEINLWYSAGSTLDARTNSLGIQSNTFDIWGVQVEAGSTATPFQTASGTIAGELQLAQRYYWRTTSNGTAATAIGQLASASSTTTVSCPLKCPVIMRVTPTSVDFSNLAVLDVGASRINVTAVALDNPSPDIASVSLTSSGLTTQRSYVLYNQSSATGYIGFSAEL